ncbi:MAG TPA: radical SAM protein [Polyangia bacterium]
MATVILKATEACNSACAYCDVVRKPKAGPPAMSLAVLEQVFVRADELLRAHPDEELELVWHGGEPLLLGPAFFDAALALQERHCATTKGRLRHDIQTNLSLFSRDFARIFRALGMDGIGTSYDPIAGVRGPGATPDTAAYNARFMRGVALLEEEGFGWGVIYVVTRLALARPLDVFHFMTNLKPDGAVNFHPVLVYGEDERGLAITPEEFADFLGALAPVWWRHRDRYREVEPFRSFLRNALEGPCSLGCVDAGDCGTSHWNIAPDGRVSHCGRSADWGLLDYGSIFDRSLAQMRTDPQRGAFAARDRRLPAAECAGCRLWGICHGGCALDSWAVTRSLEHRTPWCAAKRRFIERHFEPLTGLRFDLAAPAVAP